MQQPKALDLFQAYQQEKLPRDGGYIVSSFFNPSNTYSIYEVVAYSGVKNIYLTEDGLNFQTDGNKIFILVEPPTFPQKYIEPFRRDMKHQIPLRFSELEIFTAKNQTKIMVSKNPIMTYTAFSILKPTGINFSLIFYQTDEIFETLQFFFNETLNKEAGVPKSDARLASQKIMEGLKKFTIW